MEWNRKQKDNTGHSSMLILDNDICSPDENNSSSIMTIFPFLTRVNCKVEVYT